MRFGRTGIATLVATVATTALPSGEAPAGGLPPAHVPPPAPPTPWHLSEQVARPDTPAGDRAAAPPPRRGARRAEELVGTFGVRWWRDLRAQAVSGLNRAATATFGPLDRDRAAALGRGSWFEDADVDVFVVGRTEDASFVAVPAGTTVTEDGEVLVPPPDASAYIAPMFAGPWGTSTTSFFTALNTDDGGVSCGATTARTVLRATWRKLDDRSSTRDYWGVDLAALSEVAITSDCNDFVDTARIGFRSSAPGQVVGEEPGSGRTQHCSSRTVSVGSSWGGVSSSVSQAFTHCERIGVHGAFQPASVTRSVIFDNNGNCHAGDTPYDGRELAQVGVVEVPQGAAHGLVLSFGVDAGNASTCKEDSVLSLRPAIGAVAALALCACGAAAGESPHGQRATVGRRDVVLTTADGEVCVTSQTVPRPCAPVVASGEPVVSASLAPLDATAGLVMVLTRPDVVVTGLGAGATRTTVRSGGTELLVWLRMVPAGTAAICASYRASEGDGRLVVHRTLTLAATEAGAVEPEPDDVC